MTDLSSTEETLMFEAMGPMKLGITPFYPTESYRLMLTYQELFHEGLVSDFDITKTSDVFKQTGLRINAEILKDRT